MGEHQALQGLRVIIVGGSIAGLFAGVVLSTLPRVRSITILERFQEHLQRDQGAGIRLSNEFLDSMTRYADVRPEDYCIATRWLRLMDEKGDILMERDLHPQVMWSSSWYQIFRALITKFTAADQDKTRYRHQCPVHNLVDRGGTVEIQFSNEEGKTETAEAELAICADGISSTMKQLLVPECKRTYAGYTILRGLVLESQLSPEVLAVFDDSAVSAYNHNSQMLSYWVPSNEGQFSRDKRYFNWGWYSTYSEEELDDIMTDSFGTRRRFTMPQGSLKEEVANQIRARAREELPPAFAEAVSKTKQPFVQVITDSTAPQTIFLGGKVIMIGDAVAGQRPHSASSCTQSAFHGLLLESYLRGSITLDQLSRQALEFSKVLVDAGKEIGSYTQSTELTPTEKNQKFMASWFPVQARLTAKYKKAANKVANVDRSQM